MKNNIRKTYLSIVLITLSVAVVILCYKQCDGKSVKQIPISYDKNDISPLDDFKNYEESISFKEHGMILKKVDRLGDSLAEAYNLTGENGIGWDDEGGEVKRIKIKLKSGRTVVYDNDNGGWLEIFKKEDYSLPIADRIKIPEQSQKIQKHPYGITLDMDNGDQILMLFGYQYSTDPARLLTLIYIGKDQAEIIFNKHFNVFEIREQEQGYSLIGRLHSIDNEVIHADPYEIAIKDGKLTFKQLPLQKLYEGQDPHIILHNSIGWSSNAQPGEFTRLEIVAPTDSKNQENQVFNVDYYGDLWTPFAIPIKLPANTTTIKQTSYFIILENPNGRIIILSRRNDKENTSARSTILRSAPSYPTSLYHGFFILQEITEDDTAYHLLGTRKNAEDPNKVYEITINKAAMSEVECNW